MPMVSWKRIPFCLPSVNAVVSSGGLDLSYHGHIFV